VAGGKDLVGVCREESILERFRKSGTQGPAVFGSLALVLAMLAAWFATVQNCIGRANENDGSLVRVGEFAPDFELPRLTITNDPNGKPIGVISETDTVRLSSFRGKRPVCLIMSSYT